MTPEPTDLLRGARRTIEEIVLPALSDPFAIEQANGVLRVLLHLESVIDDGYVLEWEEARDFGRFLEIAAGLVGVDDEELRAAAVSAPSGEAPPSYRELRDANVRRKALVTGLVRGPLRGASDAARESFDELVRGQLARERRWTSPGRRKEGEKP
jgi:hypothetical protein